MKSHSKIIFSLFAVILLGPMLFAWVLFNKHEQYQIKLNNNGDLITPTMSINEMSLYDLQKKTDFKGADLKGKWWLIYVGPNQCYAECQNTLYNMRQLRLALGKNTERVDRLFIPHPSCPLTVCEQFLNEFYPDMLRAKVTPEHFQQTFGKLTNNVDRALVGEIYILDPHGQVMMRYPADAEAKDILSDIKRLLKVSKIG